MRPLHKKEADAGLTACVKASDDHETVAVTTVGSASARPVTRAYKFFRCIPHSITQADFFEATQIKSLLDSAMDG